MRDGSAWLARDRRPRRPVPTTNALFLVKMCTQELWGLAIVVTGNIAGVAADAANAAKTSLVGQTRLRSTSASQLEKIRILNLGVLAAKLIEVRFTLENPQSSQEETISRRLPRLLAQLEEVCTVRK